MPDVVPVMLYIAVKRSPVVGLEVRPVPRALTATRCRVSIVSVELQTDP